MGYKGKCKQCDSDFEAKTMFAKYCSPSCRMKTYRTTSKGKASYTKYNQANYKRPESILQCQCCGEPFNSTRKNRITCDKSKCKDKALYLAQLSSRSKYPDRIKARGLVNKHTERGKLDKQPCCACNAPEAEAHHQDYSKPLDITWLCKQHHEQLHKAINERENVFPLY